MGTDLLFTSILVGGFASLVAVARRRKSERRSRSATVSLVIDADGVQRTLADGRRESALWRRVREVEVVCTPVKTAAGAAAIVLVDSGTDDAPAGCLIPLGVGYDDALVKQLSALPRFRMEAFDAARSQRAPSRRTVWTPDSSGHGTGHGHGHG